MAAVSQGVPVRALLVGTDTNGVITGVTSGSAHAPINCAAYPYLTVYVVAAAACSAGTLILEERDQPSDTPGTIATLNLASIFSAAGGTYAYHVPVSAFGYLSAKIGTTVTGTGATVYAVLRAI